MTDLFGTAVLRRAVLDAWAASPARFREDANTEEDQGRGYYRDRVIVELAQNAADAASAAGVRGHLSVVLRPDDDGGFLLEARNTGAPLTAAGVGALATMRASAKSRPAPTAPTAPVASTAPVSPPESAASSDADAAGSLVGRFGVGFAAVRAVSDSIEIVSNVADDAAAGVRFDVADVQELLATTAQSDLAQEVAARGVDLPILRLPFPVSRPRVSGGFTTAVVLRLRDARAVAAVRAQLEALDDLLLLALAGLERISIAIEGESAGSTRELVLKPGDWTSIHRGGELPASLLADRPVEERSRSAWSVTWAFRTPSTSSPSTPSSGAPSPNPPSSSRDGLRRVIHAPTATDEPCTLPATLIATFPLDPSRRHVAPGPVTDEIVARAGAAYAELVGRVAREGGPALDLVPTGLAAGVLDAALHEVIRERLAQVALLPALTPGPEPVLLRGSDAVLLQGPLAHERSVAEALAETITDLTWVPAQHAAAARVLGVGTRPLADVIEALPATTPRLLDVFSEHIDAPGVVEALADLPLRLVDGRVVHGVRGVVILADLAQAGELEALSRWGLRVADPEQAHPLWLRLGALGASPTTVLGLPAVHQAIAHVSGLVDSTAFREELEPEDADALEALMMLVRRAVADGELPSDLRSALAGLPVESADGELEAARDLTLPGSLGDELFDGLLPAADHEVAQWGPQVLEALGVRTGIGVVTFQDVVADFDAALDDPDDAEPDRWGDYLAFLAEQLGAGAYVGEVRALADLDAVADEQWARFLGLVRADASARAALVEPVRGQPSYAAWWLREHFGAPFARPGAGTPYVAQAPQELRDLDPGDDGLWHALGGVGSLAQLDAAQWDVIFDRTPDVGSRQDMATAVELWAALAAVARQRSEELPAAPDRVVARMGASAVVCEMGAVVVTAEPMWAQPGAENLVVGGLVPAPDAQTAELVAEFLDVDLLSAQDIPARVLDPGRAQTIPAAVAALLERRTESAAAKTWVEHAQPFPVETDDDGGTASVTWWVTSDGVPHAVGPHALACALAQAHGMWRDRHLLEALLLSPDDASALLADGAWD